MNRFKSCLAPAATPAFAAPSFSADADKDKIQTAVEAIFGLQQTISTQGLVDLVDYLASMKKVEP